MIIDEAGWFAICFTIFVVFFYGPIKKAIIGFLDTSIKKIADELHDAKSAKAHAEKEMHELKEALTLSEHQHKEMLKKAKRELEVIFDNRCAEFKKTMEYREKAAQASMRQMKIDAARAVEDSFLDLVIKNVISQITAKSSSKLDIQILQNISKKNAA